MRQNIIDKITIALQPKFLEVIDESHKHIGHVGSSPNGESHFKIIIKSQQLSKISKIQAHRKIYEILEIELRRKIHALVIEII